MFRFILRSSLPSSRPLPILRHHGPIDFFAWKLWADTMGQRGYPCLGHCQTFCLRCSKSSWMLGCVVSLCWEKYLGCLVNYWPALGPRSTYRYPHPSTKRSYQWSKQEQKKWMCTLERSLRSCCWREPARDGTEYVAKHVQCSHIISGLLFGVQENLGQWSFRSRQAVQLCLRSIYSWWALSFLV